MHYLFKLHTQSTLYTCKMASTYRRCATWQTYVFLLVVLSSTLICDGTHLEWTAPSTWKLMIQFIYLHLQEFVMPFLILFNILLCSSFHLLPNATIITCTLFQNALSPFAQSHTFNICIQHVVINLVCIQLLKHWWNGVKPVPIITRYNKVTQDFNP